MKKIILLLAIILLAGQVFAQDYTFWASELNGLDTSEKIERCFNLLGKTIPTNYKHIEDELYSENRNPLEMTFEDYMATISDETVDLLISNGKIQSIIIYKLYENEDDWRIWYNRYYRELANNEDYILVNNMSLIQFRNGNKIIMFDLPERIEIYKNEYRYYSYIYFFKETM